MTSGKVTLMSNNAAISDSQGQSEFQDFIGYGGGASTAPDASEGGNPAPTDSNTSALRKNEDTNNNGNDYKRVTPTPLNSNSSLPITLILQRFDARTRGNFKLVNHRYREF